MRKSTRKDRNNGSRIYIDPSDFVLMRHRAFLTTEKAAKLLDVTHRTLLNWERGVSRIPYTAFRVLKIKVGYLFDDEHFGDWFVRGDTLWSPEGRGFKPHELRYIGNYFWMARKWIAEQRAAGGRFAPVAVPQSPTLDANIEGEVASGVSPTLSGTYDPVKAGTLTPAGVRPLRGQSPEVFSSMSAEKRPKDFERFLETLGIAA